MSHVDGIDDGVGYGVYGNSDSYDGVHGDSQSGNGVVGVSSSSYGVYGKGITGLAAYLDGNVTIAGNLTKGGGSFKIDHPLDPANKYLCHSFVESPDMKNVYDGVVMLDGNGEAEIELPDWFGALNKDFRYQLTAIGAPGSNCILQRKYLRLIQTTVVKAAVTRTTTVASRLQEVLQV